MVFRFLIAFVFFVLAAERLTLAAAFFFILLCPCGPHWNSDRSWLWKSKNFSYPATRGLRRDAAFYTHKLTLRQLHQSKCNLLHGRRVLQVDLIVFAANDAVADHLGAPALLEHLVGIQGLGHARAAAGAVRALETAAQAGVAMVAVAVAIARLLVQST